MAKDNYSRAVTTPPPKNQIVIQITYISDRCHLVMVVADETIGNDMAGGRSESVMYVSAVVTD